jgi:hypothetical protein
MMLNVKQLVNGVTINNYVLYEKCDEDYFEWEAFQLATTGRYDGVVLSNLS